MDPNAIRSLIGIVGIIVGLYIFVNSSRYFPICEKAPIKYWLRPLFFLTLGGALSCIGVGIVKGVL
jgi:hypothetical protein